MNEEIDSRIFRKALIGYPYVSDSTGLYIHYITKVNAFQTENGARVVIETHRPGILIGAQGEQIEGIKNYMSKKCGQNVTIEIIESQLFQNLYD